MELILEPREVQGVAIAVLALFLLTAGVLTGRHL